MTRTISASTLRAAMTGPVLEAGDDGYDEARDVYNGDVERRPAVIARCAGPADVAAALAHAQATGLRVADTSVLPWVPSRGTAATAVMIEKPAKATIICSNPLLLYWTSTQCAPKDRNTPRQNKGSECWPHRTSGRNQIDLSPFQSRLR